jgi:hypothetical protein
MRKVESRVYLVKSHINRMITNLIKINREVNYTIS